MFDFTPMEQVLVLIAVAYFSFMFGRLSAGSRESPEAREMRQLQEREAAAEVFSALSPTVQAEIDHLLMEKKARPPQRAARCSNGLNGSAVGAM